MNKSPFFNLLEHLDFPLALHPDLLDLYAQPHNDLALALAHNNSFVPSATTLLARRPEVANYLTLHQSLPLLKAVLALPRTIPVSPFVVLKEWDLEVDDQRRLLARHLHASECDDLLYSGLLDPTVLPDLAPRGSLAAHLDFLVRNDAPDDDVFTTISSYPITTRNIKAVIYTLLARPVLREQALHSDVPALAAAACWTPLPRADQAAALDLALRHQTEHQLSSLSPLVGLLTVPGLDPALRPVATLALTAALRNLMASACLREDTKIAIAGMTSTTTFLRRNVLAELVSRPSSLAPAHTTLRTPASSSVSPSLLTPDHRAPLLAMNPWTALGSYDLRDICPHITAVLGDATTPSSIQSWYYFLDLAATRTHVSLRELLDAARALARAACAPSGALHKVEP